MLVAYDQDGTDICTAGARLVAWLCGYALLAAKAGGLLTRPRIKAALDRVSGCVLIGLGLRLAV